MDIQVLGAWGELLGGFASLVAAIGVIITLLYLARQTKQNTDQMRAQIAHGIMSALRNAGGSEGDLVFRGLSGLDNLEAHERFRFSNWCSEFFRVFEEAYLHHAAGRLEDAYWDSLSSQFEMVLGVKGVRECWLSTPDIYNPKFKLYGDSLIANTE